MLTQEWPLTGNINGLLNCLDILWMSTVGGAWQWTRRTWLLRQGCSQLSLGGPSLAAVTVLGTGVCLLPQHCSWVWVGNKYFWHPAHQSKCLQAALGGWAQPNDVGWLRVLVPESTSVYHSATGWESLEFESGSAFWAALHVLVGTGPFG